MKINIQAPISVGELFDKLTILEIKVVKINDPKKQINIKHELESLMALVDDTQLDKIHREYFDLKKVNECLWNIEDEIRELEREKDFGDRFIQLARGVYYNNDKRSELKRTINTILKSGIIEEKSYKEY